MSSGRVDLRGECAGAGSDRDRKNPNLGTYKICRPRRLRYQQHGGAARVDKRWRDFLAVWVEYNRGIGQMREWFTKGCRLPA